MRRPLAISSTSRYRCLLLLASLLAFWLSGCVEVVQHSRVHDDGSVSVKVTVLIDTQYEAKVLPEIKKELGKKLPPGVRVDYSRRIDGKAAVIVEADGAAAAALLKEDGSTTITVSDLGFMRRRYEVRAAVPVTVDLPFRHRAVLVMPGSIEEVTGGTKTSSDTVEFDFTSVRRGTIFRATSTAFAFNFGGIGKSSPAVAATGVPSWLMPVSIASSCVGIALLLIGWFRSRQATHSRALPHAVAVATPSMPMPAPTEDASSVFCSECGVRNALGRKFCNQCGQDLR